LYAGAAYAQGGAGDGVNDPGAFPLAAPAGKDSGARAHALAGAVNTGPFNIKTWKFGHATDPVAGAQLWNPAKIKMVSGGRLYSDTLDPQRQTPDQYCAAANKDTNDFIWTEMQHSAGTWHDVALMWDQCPHAHAVPGARIPNANEYDEQHAMDMGALVLVIPTVRSVAEAKEGVKWAYYPPMGSRSQGSGVAPQFWGDMSKAAGGYRNSINENLVLIEMIETLDGLQDVDQIAKVPGVSAIFAASSDLGNFAGYRQGQPDYEREINMVHDAALKGGIKLCGPSSWAARPDFTCFQGGPPGTGGGGRRGGRGGAGGAGGAPGGGAPAPAQ
jgi:2-keto-3-deoxy-L-rhamnonate aldolase RhmA